MRLIVSHQRKKGMQDQVRVCYGTEKIKYRSCGDGHFIFCSQGEDFFGAYQDECEDAVDDCVAFRVNRPSYRIIHMPATKLVSASVVDENDDFIVEDDEDDEIGLDSVDGVVAV